MKMGAGIAEIGGLLGDPVRAAMLVTLIGGRSLPAGELAVVGNVAPQTASFHLGKLLELSLVVVESQGKHRYYRLANEEVAHALESLASIAPMRRGLKLRYDSHLHSQHNAEMRFARSCYKHLAGRLAVELHRGLLECELIAFTSDKQYELTQAGERWLLSFTSAVDAKTLRRSRTGRPCLDWTERHPHLGGPLGVILLSTLKENRWVAARPDTRALRMTLLGRRNLESQLGLRVCF